MIIYYLWWTVIDRPLFGILLMLLFCLLAPLGDALAKLLGQSVPLAQLIFVRFAVQAILLIPLVYATGRKWRMSGWVLAFAWLRIGLLIAGITCMVIALRYLPLVDTIAIVFVMPFILLLLGNVILEEVVGRHRLIACLVGFTGTLFVIQPSFQNVGAPALLPLLAAWLIAFFMMVTRQIAKVTDPIGLQAVNGVMAMVMIAPVLWFFQGSDFAEVQMIVLSQNQIWLLLLFGLTGTAAHLVMTWSLRYAPSSTTAPLQYLEIPIATVIGWLVFSDLPNPSAAIGIVMIIAAGLYILIRERAILVRAAMQMLPARQISAAE